MSLFATATALMNVKCDYCYMSASTTHCDSTNTFIPAPHVSNILKVEPKALYAKLLLKDESDGL